MSRGAVATGQNPSVTVGKAGPNPNPVPTYGNKWVHRTYQKVISETAAGSGVLFKSDSFGVTGSFFVDKMSVWKLGLNGVGLRANFRQGTSTDLGTDDVTAEDFGSGSSLPGVTFKVPLGHAKEVTSTTVVELLQADTPNTSSTVEAYVCQLTCWVQI